MNKIAFVGNEGAKFTPQAEAAARMIIRDTLTLLWPSVVVSGRCHLGGVDVWSEEVGKSMGCFDEKLIFPPRNLSWSTGFKPRNLQIARACNSIHVIVVDSLPAGFGGLRFDKCYHCAKAGRNALDHVKSGACWTANEALKLGKPAFWHILLNSCGCQTGECCHANAVRKS